MLKNLVNKLKKHDKVIVTGPPRAGTTISGLILAHELKYKFIDESWYDGSNVIKFINLLLLPRKMVVHTTSFTRDLHHVKNIPFVLIKRPIKDILESYENSKKFKEGVSSKSGLFTKFDDEALNIILKHYGYKSGCVPKIIYDHFYKHNKDFYELEYNDLKNHKLFIKKEVRREKFKHLKQVNAENPNFLFNQKGIMVI